MIPPAPLVLLSHDGPRYDPTRLYLNAFSWSMKMILNSCQIQHEDLKPKQEWLHLCGDWVLCWAASACDKLLTVEAMTLVLHPMPAKSGAIVLAGTFCKEEQSNTRWVAMFLLVLPTTSSWGSSLPTPLPSIHTPPNYSRHFPILSYPI